MIKSFRVLIMGLTYKENVPDTRVTPVRGMIKEMKEFGIDILGFDPLLRKEEIEAFGIDAVEDLNGVNADCVILTVAHDAFKDISLGMLNGMLNHDPILTDIRGVFNRADAERAGFCYRGL